MNTDKKCIYLSMFVMLSEAKHLAIAQNARSFASLRMTKLHDEWSFKK